MVNTFIRIIRRINPKILGIAIQLILIIIAWLLTKYFKISHLNDPMEILFIPIYFLPYFLIICISVPFIIIIIFLILNKLKIITDLLYVKIKSFVLSQFIFIGIVLVLLLILPLIFLMVSVM